MDKWHYICYGCKWQCEIFTKFTISSDRGCPRQEKPDWNNLGLVKDVDQELFMDKLVNRLFNNIKRGDDFLDFGEDGRKYNGGFYRGVYMERGEVVKMAREIFDEMEEESTPPEREDIEEEAGNK